MRLKVVAGNERWSLKAYSLCCLSRRPVKFPRCPLGKFSPGGSPDQ